MKINGRMAMETPDRAKWAALGIKTFKDFGTVVKDGTTVSMNGKDVPITEDDAITWTKWCKVVYDRTPQQVNARLRAAIGEIGKNYQPDPEPRPPAQRTINAPGPNPPTDGTIGRIQGSLRARGER